MAWSIFREGGGDTVAAAWAKQFLQRINAPVTPGNLEFVYQWEKSEGGGGKYNPLNQGIVYGHPELTTTGSQYGGGAADYASWDAGLTGAADYLNTSGPDNYPAIRDALRNNDPVAARSALWRSGWAASHYGYGSNWSNAPLPGNAASINPTLPGGTTGSATVNASDTTTVADDTCAFGLNLPSLKLSIPLWNPSIGGGSACVLSKTAVRAMLGGVVLILGAGVALIGVVQLLKYGVDKSGAASYASSIPVAGKLVR